MNVVLPRICTHEFKRLTRKPPESGGLVGYQCQECGRRIGEWVKKSAMSSDKVASLPLWDDNIREVYWQRYHTERKGLMSADEADNDPNWWAWYGEYLKSPEWRERRRLVLERESGLCQGCRLRSAEHVHHTSYKHAGNEPLYDLMALCEPCHERAHGRKIGS